MPSGFKILLFTLCLRQQDIFAVYNCVASAREHGPHPSGRSVSLLTIRALGLWVSAAIHTHLSTGIHTQVLVHEE